MPRPLTSRKTKVNNFILLIHLFSLRSLNHTLAFFFMNLFHCYLMQSFNFNFSILDEGEATTSFLLQLSTWDKEELDDKLANRVQVSKRAVAKVIQAFDRLMQRNEKITLALKGELDGGMFNN